MILIEPPLEEYARSYGVTNTKFWEWEKIMALDIGAVWMIAKSVIYLLSLPALSSLGGGQSSIYLSLVWVLGRPGPGKTVPADLGIQAVRGHLLDPDELQEPGH